MLTNILEICHTKAWVNADGTAIEHLLSVHKTFSASGIEP